MPSSSPDESPSEKAKTRDVFTAMTRGFRASTVFRSTCHCASPQSSACAAPRVPAGPAAAVVDRTAWYTPPCDVPPSAIRSTVQPVGVVLVPRAAHWSKNT